MVPDEPELHRFRQWHEAIFSRPSVQLTQLFDKDPELLIDVHDDADDYGVPNTLQAYAHYAEGTPLGPYVPPTTTTTQ